MRSILLRVLFLLAVAFSFTACAGTLEKAQDTAATLKPLLVDLVQLLDKNETLPGVPAALASTEALMIAWTNADEERFEAVLPCAAEALAHAAESARLEGGEDLARHLDAVASALRLVGRDLVCAAPAPEPAPDAAAPETALDAS